MSSDPIDQGSEAAELFLKAALSKKKPEGNLKPIGACHYCSERVAPGQLFCPRDCSNDWHEEQRLKQISGKA